MDGNYTQPINIGNPVEHTIEGECCTVCDWTKSKVILQWDLFCRVLWPVGGEGDDASRRRRNSSPLRDWIVSYCYRLSVERFMSESAWVVALAESDFLCQRWTKNVRKLFRLAVMSVGKVGLFFYCGYCYLMHRGHVPRTSADFSRFSRKLPRMLNKRSGDFFLFRWCSIPSPDTKKQKISSANHFRLEYLFRTKYRCGWLFVERMAWRILQFLPNRIRSHYSGFSWWQK